MSIRCAPDGPNYRVVNGFNFAPGFTEEDIRSGLDYKAREDDVFIVTYPKCGTTWTQQIMILLYNQGELPQDVVEGGIYVRSVFLEAQGADAANAMPRPNAIKTHLNYDLQPKHPTAKYIIVLRNPKDACVSFFYHHTRNASYNYEGRTFSDFFPHWLNGDVECGNYFDWVLSWWRHRDDSNVLVLFYEDMKVDTKAAIKKIVDFVGLEVTDDTIEKTMNKSSVEYMRDTNKIKNVRKGIVGDWRNHLSEDQNELMEKAIKAKFAGTELEHFWNKFDVIQKK